MFCGAKCCWVISIVLDLLPLFWVDLLLFSLHLNVIASNNFYMDTFLAGKDGHGIHGIHCPLSLCADRHWHCCDGHSFSETHAWHEEVISFLLVRLTITSPESRRP